ncbi:MAG: Coenzyme F420 hydrogenase/dehydrogenase, beta subunit C-terminal domain [Clostridia bacterium]|nr:Coenzyme F420 hydrogenase/dehydrogenase, beta subunit C-terminal domain [Clostridia bacterium]
MMKLAEKSICTGCGACFNICPKKCIQMKSDYEGFLYPVVDEDSCINCGLCQSVCAVLEFKSINTFISPIAIAAYNKDLDKLNESSSGGVFITLAESIIKRGGIVYGAALSEDFSVVHKRIASLSELQKLQGSKYSQSNVGYSYAQVKEDLLLNKEVLFSGTPCQVAALKSFLKKPYEKLLCVDIICHSVPSPRVWSEYLNQITNSLGEVASVNFRDKRDSWQRYCLSVKTKDEFEIIKKADNNYYMKAFINGLCTRSSCYNCEFKGQNRASDITLGDFWGCEQVCPDFTNDRGTSLVLIQTDKGKSVFDKIKMNLIYREVDANDALVQNPAYSTKSTEHRNRTNFFKRFESEDFEELVRELLLPTRKDIISKRIQRSFIGKALRKIKRYLHKAVK